MNALIVEGKADWIAFLRKHEKALIVAISLALFALLVKRLIWGMFDHVSFWTIVVVAFTWYWILSDWFKEEGTAHSERIAFRLGGVISALSMWTLFFVNASGDGVWVNKSVEMTTLSHALLPVSPFSTGVQFVSNNLDQTLPIDVQGTDTPPLACEVTTWGVRLDTRDPADSERRLLLTALIHDDIHAWYLRGLQLFLTDAAKSVLSSKTGEQITAQRRSNIPYEISQGVAWYFVQNRDIRWQDGSITYTCNLKKLNT